MESFVWQFLVSLMVAVVTATLTVWLAFRRFRAERWWDKKAEAYSRIFEALHHSKRMREQDVKNIEEHRIPQDIERQQTLRKRFAESMDEIYKAVDMSAFLLSSEAQESLNALVEGLDEADEHAEVESGHISAVIALRGELEVIENCLDKLPAIARRDLGVP